MQTIIISIFAITIVVYFRDNFNQHLLQDKCLYNEKK